MRLTERGLFATNKHVPLAVAMFITMIVTAFARGYFTDEDIYWWIEAVSALGVAILCYALAPRQLQKAESASKPDN